MSAPTRLRNVAVVLAGGTGQRVGLHIPKQLVKVAGKTILEHTLDVFEDAEEVDEVIVLMAPGFLPEAQAIVGSTHPKVTNVIEGGVTRNDSTRIALAALGQEECNVLFHDAVRPLVDHRIITDCVEALQTYQAVDVAIPSADTIVVIDDQGCIESIPSRATLRRGQTPQAFRLSVIRRAYEIGFADPDFNATDDCGVVLRYLPEVPIFVVEGTDQNLKITQPIDIFVADKLFQLGSTIAPDPVDEQVYARAPGRHHDGRPRGQLRHRGRHRFSRKGIRRRGVRLQPQPQRCGRRTDRGHRTRPGRGARRDRPDRPRHRHGRCPSARRAARRPRPEQIAEAVQINYLAPIMVARAALPYLKETHGSLLLFTSSSYTRGRAGYSLYSSAKAAVVNLTQALADEWSPLAGAGQLHQPGADRDADAHQRFRCRGPQHPARLLGRRPDVGGRPGLADDRPGDRRTTGGAAGRRHHPHGARGSPDRGCARGGRGAG